MAYPWMTHAWHAQAEAAERSARPFLSQRRWTDKDVVVSMASPPLMFGWGATTGWPEIPKGVGADFEGERALRVFLEITDGPEQRPLAPEAILFAKLSGADAVQAGLTKNDVFLVVPLPPFVWVAGALSFDKKVLLSLSQPIMEGSLVHKDAEIWPELVWITPMKGADRKYYYAVLPLVGMGGVIDPQKGNPSIFRDLQADPYRHIVWDIVDEVIDGGTSAWGQAAASGDGAATLFALKLRLVNFLRDLADKFQEEEFERMVRRGEFDRQALGRAIGDGLFGHLPDPQRIARENAWLRRADIQWWGRFKDLCDRELLLGAFNLIVSAYLNGLGAGWSPDTKNQLVAAVDLVFRTVNPTNSLNALARLVAATMEGTDRTGEAFKFVIAQLMRGDLQLEHMGVVRPGGAAGVAQDTFVGTVEEMKQAYKGLQDKWMPVGEYAARVSEAERRFKNG